MIAIYLIACAVTVLGMLTANLLAAPADTVWAHARRLGRLAILSGAVGSLARVLQDGHTPAPELVVLMLGLAIVSAVQVHREASYQSERTI